ncbi:glycerophosphodiester phosphodiesterase [Loigolactobacillus zhaoyuanensis]|uniref:Glycerophosphodiester phosphodiesterase n=1 Tax=Loigolactobacillus zhaoyuanensis TaxID=2486017 RepID=A0ABW8UHL5_9LACO
MQQKKLLRSYRLLLRLSLCLSAFFIFSGFTVIGHRGDPLAAPEETFQSFNDAFAAGARYAELDLRESQDGTLVIAHDANLERISGQDISISKTNFAQLQQITQNNGESIHSLAELFAEYQNQPQARFVLETKKSKKNKPTDMEAKVAALVQQYHMENRVLVQSFSAASVESFSQLLPTVPRYLIVNELSDLNFDTMPYLTGINLDTALATPTFLQQMHTLGKKVLVWSDMDEQADALASTSLDDIDGIVTNYPQLASDYDQAKRGTHLTVLDATAATISATHRVDSATNPYLTWTAATPLAAQQTYSLDSLVTSPQHTYAAVNAQRWVNTDYLNFGSDALLAAPYLAGRVSLKPQQISYPLVASPSQPQQITGRLQGSQNATITAAKLINGQLWFELDQQGWLPAERTLITLAGAKQENQYQQLLPSAKLTDLKLPNFSDYLRSPVKNLPLSLLQQSLLAPKPIYLQAQFSPQNN